MATPSASRERTERANRRPEGAHISPSGVCAGSNAIIRLVIFPGKRGAIYARLRNRNKHSHAKSVYSLHPHVKVVKSRWQRGEQCRSGNQIPRTPACRASNLFETSSIAAGVVPSVLPLGEKQSAAIPVSSVWMAQAELPVTETNKPFLILPGAREDTPRQMNSTPSYLSQRPPTSAKPS